MDTTDIDLLAMEYKMAAAQEKAAKDLKDTIKLALLDALGDTKSIATTKYKVTQSTKEPALRLNEKLLLENGVSADIIQASKKPDKPSAPSIRVTEVKA